MCSATFLYVRKAKSGQVCEGAADKACQRRGARYKLASFTCFSPLFLLSLLSRLHLEDIHSSKRITSEFRALAFHPLIKSLERISATSWRLLLILPVPVASGNENLLGLNIHFSSAYPTTPPHFVCNHELDSMPTSWTPPTWNPAIDTVFEVFMSHLIQTTELFTHATLLKSLARKSDWSPDLVWISLGCANDLQQWYPNRLRHAIFGSGLSDLGSKPDKIEIILIDPLMTPVWGSFHHRSLQWESTSQRQPPDFSKYPEQASSNPALLANCSRPPSPLLSPRVIHNPNMREGPTAKKGQSACITVSSRPLLGEDIADLETYVVSVLDRGARVIVGDFAVGTVTGSISYKLRKTNPELWDKRVIFAKSLRRVGEPYDDGFPALDLAELGVKPYSDCSPRADRDSANDTRPGVDPIADLLQSWLRPGSMEHLDELATLHLDDFETDQDFRRETKFASLTSPFASSVIRTSSPSIASPPSERSE